MTSAQYLELARWGLAIAVPALSGLTGVVLGAYLTGRRDNAQRKLGFIEKQLNEFYSPLLGLRKEILTRSDLRMRVHDAAQTTWNELCSKARDAGGQELADLSRERYPEFEKLIEYDNRQLTEELIPSYKKMAIMFREKLWLAEPETTAYYQRLIDFVELWERWLDKSISPEILEKVNIEEESLFPLYEELQRTHDILRLKIKAGKP